MLFNLCFMAFQTKTRKNIFLLIFCSWNMVTLCALMLVHGKHVSWCVEIADSAQTEYCPTFHCSCVRLSVCHRRDISHFSHIYRHKCHVKHQGTHQTLYILNQNHPGYLSSKDQTRQDHLLRPDQPDH